MVTSTEYFPLVLSSSTLHNQYSGPNKALLVCAGEPSGDNETDDVGEAG